MLSDPLLEQRYRKHITLLIDLSEREINRTARQPQFARLARMYRDAFTQARDTFNRYGGNLVTAFKKFQDIGKLEIITCGATHGYMPLLSQDTSCQAMIKQAVQSYENFFGHI